MADAVRPISRRSINPLIRNVTDFEEHDERKWMVLHYVIFVELFLAVVNYNLIIRCERAAAKMLFCKKKMCICYKLFIANVSKA